MDDLEIKQAIERGIRVWPDLGSAPRRTRRGRRFWPAGRRRLSEPGLWACPVLVWRSAS